MQHYNKLLISLSMSTLITGCALQQNHHETQNTVAPSQEIVTTPQAKIEEVESSIQSIRYLQPSAGLEVLAGEEQVEPLINDKPDTAPQPLYSPAPDLLSLSIIEPVNLYADTQTHDLWQRLRQGFSLPDRNHQGVLADQKWYSSHPEYLQRVTKRAQPYMHYILSEVEARGMPAEIALLPIVESAFQPFAYSHGRAAGIWQFIPGTGKLYGLKQDWWYDGRRDVYASTQAALDYLTYLNKIFDGDWLLALAAYNSGSGTVSKAIKRNKRRGKPTDYWNLDLPKETEGYVPKLLALSNIIANPLAFNVALTPINDEPYFELVNTGGQIDLALAADLAGLTTDELYNLNPGFNRWATAPDGPHYLLIPKQNAEQFITALEQLPENERVEWVRHKIKPGESLLSISKKYQTTVSLLRDTNNLQSNMIRAGQHLLIPTATRNLDTYSKSAELRKKAIQQTKRNGYKITHKVKMGDTLWDISRKYKVGVRELAKWNGMAPRDPLRPGQKLVVWSKQPLQATAANTTPAGQLQKINYKVRRGDSLARIAQKFRVTVKDLQRWNSINPRKYLQPGQRLTLYVDVTRQSGG